MPAAPPSDQPVPKQRQSDRREMRLSTARFARDTGHETIPQRMMSHKINTAAAQSMAPIALPSMIPLAGAESSIAVVVSASSAGSTNRAALSVVAPGRVLKRRTGNRTRKAGTKWRPVRFRAARARSSSRRCRHRFGPARSMAAETATAKKVRRIWNERIAVARLADSIEAELQARGERRRQAPSQPSEPTPEVAQSPEQAECARA